MSPVAPFPLPNYLAESLPRQDEEALRDAREYINELFAVCEQRVKNLLERINYQIALKFLRMNPNRI